MNPIQQLASRVIERFPSARTKLESPATPRGSWSLDVDLGDQSLMAEWRPNRGFGLSSVDADSYGEGHDEVYSDLQSAWNRVKTLLLSSTRTRRADSLNLRVLREALEIPQTEMAEKLHIGQAAVSKLENRSDVRVSTLKSLVSALGGRLRIVAEFPKHKVDLIAANASGDDRSRPSRRKARKKSA